MGRVGIHHANGAISPPEGEEAMRLGRSPIASRGEGEEAPELLPDYFARIAMGVLPDATSLDRPVSGEGNAGQIGEVVLDERASRVAEEVVEEEAEATLLWEEVSHRPERIRHVLVRRHGLDEREPATLRELAEELGVSRERVRQLQRDAERMLVAYATGVSPAGLPSDEILDRLRRGETG